MTAIAILKPVARNRARARRFGWILAAAVLATTAALQAADQKPAEHEETSEDPVVLEYQLKAGFLFNFAKFVQWPSIEATSTNDFRIAIVDDGDVTPVIASALAGKKVNGRTVTVERLPRYREAKQFDMLFICHSEEKRTPILLRQVGDAPVLLVGESKGFASEGGCINFIRQGENLRFELNLKAAEKAGLKVSSKLASMAKVIEAPKEGK